jgi:hypothetical protein
MISDCKVDTFAVKVMPIFQDETYGHNDDDDG